jgi:hypothetical protein
VAAFLLSLSTGSEFASIAQLKEQATQIQK